MLFRYSLLQSMGVRAHDAARCCDKTSGIPSKTVKGLWSLVQETKPIGCTSFQCPAKHHSNKPDEASHQSVDQSAEIFGVTVDKLRSYRKLVTNHVSVGCTTCR